jgi:DNA-binding NarL/FixJ family response regulator
MGYIKKSFGPDVLKNVIQLILSGERFYPVVPIDSAALGGLRSDLAEAARRPTADASVELTPRQKDILHGLVNGRSNKEIARDLNIIEGTVKAHIRNMMGKLRVRNRTQLALMATRLGFIDEEGRWRN